MTHRRLKNLGNDRYSRMVAKNIEDKKIAAKRLATKMKATINKIREDLGGSTW